MRAEPIAALYEQGRIQHVGPFPELLTSAAYDAFRGVAGAIGDKADGVYGTFSDAEKNVCRALFGRLVHVSPGDTEGADTRQRATRQDIGEAGWQIAAKLAGPDVRLLVIARDPLAGQETAEVAHEAPTFRTRDGPVPMPGSGSDRAPLGNPGERDSGIHALRRFTESSYSW